MFWLNREPNRTHLESTNPDSFRLWRLLEQRGRSLIVPGQDGDEGGDAAGGREIEVETEATEDVCWLVLCDDEDEGAGATAWELVEEWVVGGATTTAGWTGRVVESSPPDGCSQLTLIGFLELGTSFNPGAQLYFSRLIGLPKGILVVWGIEQWSNSKANVINITTYLQFVYSYVIYF